MTATIQFSEVVERPLASVFNFYATNHVRNHPRWDPDIELKLEPNSPLKVGTVIQRRNSRSGTPVEGTMEVVELETNHALGMVIHDGPAVMRARSVFEAVDETHTSITTIIEIPGMDESMDKSFLLSRLERSSEIRRKLMEAEIQPGSD